MSALLDKLASWKPTRVVVVGDVMLDQLVYGDAERLTADAPVPVLAVRRTEERAGGASNVCLNLVALGCEVAVVGVVGDDREGQLLRERLEAQGVDASGLIVDTGRPTTVKRSLVGLAQHRHPQKMFRVDVESREPLTGAVRERVAAALADRLAWADVAAIEDYGKGVCSEETCAAVIGHCADAGVPVLVDPASRDDFSRYRGCTAITPNRTEAERATGHRVDDGSSAAALADELQRTLACTAVVLTLDKDGALLLEAGGEAQTIPTEAREVYDVTGAGDMVLAALAAGIGNGLAWADAVRFANAAAGLEVEVFGVQPIAFERVYRQVLRSSGALMGKGRTLEQAMVEVRGAKREGKKVVFTNGCFDILHAGHISLLRAARREGDMLVVGLNSDASVRRLKGDDRPVHDEADRVEVLSELESVDVVVVFDEDTPIRLIEALEPDVLVKGGDYTRETVVGHEIVEAAGGRVALIPLLAGRSTSGAIERMRAGGAGAAEGTGP